MHFLLVSQLNGEKSQGPPSPSASYWESQFWRKVHTTFYCALCIWNHPGNLLRGNSHQLIPKMNSGEESLCLPPDLADSRLGCTGRSQANRFGPPPENKLSGSSFPQPQCCICYSVITPQILIKAKTDDWVRDSHPAGNPLTGELSSGPDKDTEEHHWGQSCFGGALPILRFCLPKSSLFHWLSHCRGNI